MKIKLSKQQWTSIGRKAGWCKGGQLEESQELSVEELQETWESNKEDIIVNENGNAYYAGKKICGPNKDYGTDFKAIKAWMDDNNYWPNIWTVNDHGNISLYSVNNNGVETYHGGLV